MTSKVLLISKDLFFITKVKEMGAAAGAEVVVARSGDAIREQLLQPTGLIVAVDAGKPGLPLEQIAEVVAPIARAGCPVLTYFSHVDDELEQRARTLGLGEVMPRSRFVKVLPVMLCS